MSYQCARGNRNGKGSTIVEFAVAVPVLFGLVVGTLALGSALTRMLQAGSVCRNANLLAVQGFDMANRDSQSLVVKTAAGMGRTLAGTPSWPDPSGKAAVVLTKVTRVGPKACASGILNWDGNAASCRNYEQNVIVSRVVIGNQSRWHSEVGTPVSARNAKGALSSHDIASVIGNRALDLPGSDGRSMLAHLKEDEQASISEVFADI